MLVRNTLNEHELQTDSEYLFKSSPLNIIFLFILYEKMIKKSIKIKYLFFKKWY